MLSASPGGVSGSGSVDSVVPAVSPSVGLSEGSSRGVEVVLSLGSATGDSVPLGEDVGSVLVVGSVAVGSLGPEVSVVSEGEALSSVGALVPEGSVVEDV